MIKNSVLILIFLSLGMPGFSFGWCWSNYGKDYLAISPTKVELKAEGDQVTGTVLLEVKKAPGVNRPFLGAAYLVFLPSGGRITAMEGYMDGDWVPGVWLENAQAGRLFQGIVGAQAQRTRPKDPVLVQYLGGDLYRVLIFPVKEWYGKVRLQIQVPGHRTATGYELKLPQNSWWASLITDVSYELVFTDPLGVRTQENKALFGDDRLVWSSKEPLSSPSNRAVDSRFSLLAMEEGADQEALKWGFSPSSQSEGGLVSDDGFGGTNYLVPSGAVRRKLLFEKLVRGNKTNLTWETLENQFRQKEMKVYRDGNPRDICKVILQHFPGPSPREDMAREFRTNFVPWRDLTYEELHNFKPKRANYLAQLLNDFVDKFDYYGLWEYPASPWDLFPILVEEYGYGKS